MVEICVLQGTVATFFGCGGQERDLLHEFFTYSVHHKSFVWLILTGVIPKIQGGRFLEHSV